MSDTHPHTVTVLVIGECSYMTHMAAVAVAKSAAAPVVNIVLVMEAAGDSSPAPADPTMGVSTNRVHSVARETNGAVASVQVRSFKSLGATGSVYTLRNQCNSWGVKSVVMLAMVQKSSNATSV
jgi:hypothetical protein